MSAESSLKPEKSDTNKAENPTQKIKSRSVERDVGVAREGIPVRRTFLESGKSDTKKAENPPQKIKSRSVERDVGVAREGIEPSTSGL